MTGVGDGLFVVIEELHRDTWSGLVNHNHLGRVVCADAALEGRHAIGLMHLGHLLAVKECRPLRKGHIQLKGEDRCFHRARRKVFLALIAC